MAALTDPSSSTLPRLQALQDAARARGVQLSIHQVTLREEIALAIDAAKAKGAEALNVLASALLFNNREIVLQRVAALRLPAIYQWIIQPAARAGSIRRVFPSTAYSTYLLPDAIGAERGLQAPAQRFRAASCNNFELAGSLKALAHRRAVPIDELDDTVLLLWCIGAWLICRRSDALLVLCDQVAVLLIGCEPHLG